MLNIQNFDTFVADPASMPLPELTAMVNRLVQDNPKIKIETISKFFSTLPLYFSSLPKNKKEMSDHDWELFDRALSSYLGGLGDNFGEIVIFISDKKATSRRQHAISQLVDIESIAKKHFCHLPEGYDQVLLFGPAQQKIILPRAYLHPHDSSKLVKGQSQHYEIHLEGIEARTFSVIAGWCGNDFFSLDDPKMDYLNNINEDNIVDILTFSHTYGFAGLFQQADACFAKLLAARIANKQKNEPTLAFQKACLFYVESFRERMVFTCEPEKITDFLKQCLLVVLGPLSQENFVRYFDLLPPAFFIDQGFMFFAMLSEPQQVAFFEKLQKDNLEQKNKQLFWLILNWKIDQEIRKTLNPLVTGIHRSSLPVVGEKGDAHFFIRLGEEGSITYIQRFLEQLQKVNYFPINEMHFSLLPPLSQGSSQNEEKETPNTHLLLGPLLSAILSEKNCLLPKKIHFHNVEAEKSPVLFPASLEIIWKAFFSALSKKQELEKIAIFLDGTLLVISST